MTRTRRFRPGWISIVACLALGTGNARACPAQHISPEDENAVRNAEQAYVKAWLANQPDSVLATLMPDAVILPAEGPTPVEGIQAIRDFWWGADVPATTVTSFDVQVDEVGGCRDLAFLRGRFSIESLQEREGESVDVEGSGSVLALFRRQPDGTWRIWRQIWNDWSSEEE